MLGIDILRGYISLDASHDSYLAESKAKCLEGTRAQYIQDITTWTTSLDQMEQRQLLWMYGAAGVGKSAVAKSCAIEAEAHGVLGASFFFSRDYGVVNPVLFFPTIAYQLSAKIPAYRAIIDASIQKDVTILRKGLGIQLNELILKPFRELEERDERPSQKVVFVDGLDECNDEPAQAKIVELVTKAIVDFEDGHRLSPLLWAFSSRPESHIHAVFSKHFSSPVFWRVELPVSRDYDADIILYFRHKLQLPDPARQVGLSSMGPRASTWPSDEELDILVRLVAGLFIYAATIVRFIMDPKALSPQRQFLEVRRLYERQENHSGVTLELDAFYSLLMSQIPSKQLLIVQQFLLINHEISRNTWQQTPQRPDIPTKSPSKEIVQQGIRIPANILGLTMQELENCFSRLRSVLAFRLPKNSRSSYSCPESTMIYFYHASFLEFLLSKSRSGEYWIKDQRHYAAIAVRGLRLFNDMFMMNGISPNEKIQRLRRLLPLFPDATNNQVQCFMVSNEFLYEFLCNHVLGWCIRSGLDTDTVQELRAVDLANLRRPLMCISNEDLKSLSKELQSIIGMSRQTRWKIPEPIYMASELPMTKRPGDSVPLEAAWAYIAPVLYCNGLQLSQDEWKDWRSYIWDICEDPGSSRYAYIHSQITLHYSSHMEDVFSHMESIDLDDLSDLELIDYYTYEWLEYYFRLKFFCVRVDVPRTITRAALRPWKKFVTHLQGDNRRLTNAALGVLQQKRNQDILPHFSLRPRPSDLSPFTSFRVGVLEVFVRSLEEILSTSDPGPPFPTQDEFLQATETYYDTQYVFSPEKPLLANLEYVNDCLNMELHNLSFLGLSCKKDWIAGIMKAATEALLRHHWAEVYSLFEEALIHTICLSTVKLIQDISRYSPQATSKLQELMERLD
ncbi:hypothetical protein NP233_g12450 [Leucocoprinus birnbaumii]|uniref:Nephrocystin 3-like N-terminal domain-containing protein n=1 Tax=Leucocoprinus birnbaumii TaxID=56174 RepID=A0AAD5VFN5_9AGAR|nr:hypothetical protein NP233_g12450 [Leucocoprinus birnbaumii]